MGFGVGGRPVCWWSELMCYCGDIKTFENCCEMLISGRSKVNTALELMRSRYSAYVLGDMDYIQKTMRAPIQKNSKIPLFIKLEIMDVSIHQVEFKAYFLQKGKLGILHERSHFIFDQGEWLYIDGIVYEMPLKLLALNGSCPCGSEKKYKNCHY